MKHLTMNSMLAAAVVVLAAGSASAQTLKADVPFTFQAAGVGDDAGNLRDSQWIEHGEVRGPAKHRHEELGVDGVLVRVMCRRNSNPEARPRSRSSAPARSCAIREMWTGSGIASYRFKGPKLARTAKREWR